MEHPIRELSGGQKAKVLLLKMSLSGANVLILDEPTAVLAPQEPDQLFDELIHIKEQGHTIVFISHDMAELERMCDSIRVLRDGHFVGTLQKEEITQDT